MTQQNIFSALVPSSVGALAPVTMSSREIAELVGSTHDSVLKTVRRLIAEGVVFGNDTLYKHPQNGQTYPEFVLDFRKGNRGYHWRLGELFRFLGATR